MEYSVSINRHVSFYEMGLNELTQHCPNMSFLFDPSHVATTLPAETAQKVLSELQFTPLAPLVHRLLRVLQASL